MGTIMSGVRNEYIGSASGILSTVMQTANALGIAVIGTVFFSSLSQHGIQSDTSELKLQIHSFTVSLGWSVVLAVITLIFLFCLQARKSSNTKGDQNVQKRWRQNK